MAFDERTSNLFFLLSLSPLIAGCPGGDDTSGETTETPLTTSGPDTGTSDSTGTPMMTSSTEGSGSGSGSTTAETADSGTAGDTTGGLYCEEYPPMMVMGPIDPVCEMLAAQNNECYYGGTLSEMCLEYYQAGCQYGIEYATMAYGEMCGMAYLDLYACIAALSCEELEMLDDQCDAEYMATVTACMGA